VGTQRAGEVGAEELGAEVEEQLQFFTTAGSRSRRVSMGVHSSVFSQFLASGG